jgi:CheY-like chemotaxis protein
MSRQDRQVLLVEDNEAKRNSVEALLHREFPFVKVRHAFSVKSAIEELGVSMPDMIIADMSLPTYDIEGAERGGTPRSFGGIEVFEFLARYEMTVPVLVVTSYPAITDGLQSMDLTQLTLRLKEEFPACFTGTVYFDSTYSTWERDIIAYLKPLRKDGYVA